MIDIELDASFTEKQNCCGCTACAAICPKSCIEMQEDNEGFLYPVVDKQNCVNCKACERVCPILNIKKEMPSQQFGYIVQNKDAAVLRESTAEPNSQNLKFCACRGNGEWNPHQDCLTAENSV